MTSTPPVTIIINPTPDRCEYGGVASVRIALAGTELLRYEAASVEDAQDWADHLEWTQPRIHDRDATWEFVLHMDSGFYTLRLSDREHGAVLRHTKHMFPNDPVTQRMEATYTKYRRLATWLHRRGEWETKRAIVID